MAKTKQQLNFEALAKQSTLTTEFSGAWQEFKDEPSVAAAHDVIAKSKAVLAQANVTGKEMIAKNSILHRQYIAEDYLDNPPAESTKKGFGSNTEYKTIKHPQTGEQVYAKVTKYTFGQ